MTSAQYFAVQWIVLEANNIRKNPVSVLRQDFYPTHYIPIVYIARLLCFFRWKEWKEGGAGKRLDVSGLQAKGKDHFTSSLPKVGLRSSLRS